ncbi:matrixin family metalloprotease [Companilactobacillus mishanensis]|uniref:Peptidase metallopeptidase domain-containing protein n=1 Tax=Companilactobacillus mishanensis TaxID=2486008 RepID=A0A5P0ZJ27_9LACO|nr:matrixin family metalloprotease [Companilactobacillus mishanensis]MQS53100.1 hypothetical protein [Companilactobacillus mishanensis]
MKKSLFISMIIPALLLSSLASTSVIPNPIAEKQQTVQAASDPVQDYQNNPYQLAYYRFNKTTIPYRIDNSNVKVTTAQLNAIQQAVNELNAKTIFTFVRDDNSTDGISISSASGIGDVADTSWGQSSNGYLKKSEIRLNASNIHSSTKSVIEHEFGHAIGLLHNGSDTLMAYNSTEGYGVSLTSQDIEAFRLAGTLPPGDYHAQNTPTVVSVSPNNRQIGMYDTYWQVNSDAETTAKVKSSSADQNFSGAAFHPVSRVIRPDNTIVYRLANGKYVADYGWTLGDGAIPVSHNVLQTIGNVSNLPTTDLRDGYSNAGVLKPDIIQIKDNISDQIYSSPGGIVVGTEPANSAWAVGEIKKANGFYWYKIGSNAWLMGHMKFNSSSFNSPKTITTVRNAQLYNSEGKLTSRTLDANTSWLTSNQLSINDQLLYKVSIDEYLLASDVRV